jgi:hypothetical protein
LKLGGIHGVISQKMILFMTTAVKTSNPTTPFLIPEVPALNPGPRTRYPDPGFSGLPQSLLASAGIEL